MELIKVRKLSFLVLFLLFMPGMVFSLLGISSLSFGLLLFFMLTIFTGIIEPRFFVFKKYQIYIVSTVLLVVLAHSLIVNLNQKSEVNLLRQISSIYLLLLMMVSSIFTLNFINHTKDSDFSALIIFVFKIMTFTLAVSAVLFHLGYNSQKSLLFFKEPSHLAMIYGAFLTYCLKIMPVIRKVMVVALVLVLSIIMQNLTLMIVLLLAAAMLVKKSSFGLIFIFISSFIVLFVFQTLNLQLNDGYFSQRLNFSGDTTNLSVLVYLSGIERAYLSLVSTSYLGIGYQNLGYIGPQGRFIEVIFGLSGTRANFNDGGFLAAKIISEFGALGFFLVSSYLFLFFKYFLESKINNNVDYFLKCCFVFFSIEMFVRGAGYFTIGMVLFAVSTFYLLSREYCLEMKEKALTST